MLAQDIFRNRLAADPMKSVGADDVFTIDASGGVAADNADLSFLLSFHRSRAFIAPLRALRRVGSIYPAAPRAKWTDLRLSCTIRTSIVAPLSWRICASLAVARINPPSPGRG